MYNNQQQIKCDICEADIGYSYLKRNDGVSICLDCVLEELYS